MSWERGDGWSVTGAVVRAPYVNQAGTFAALTLGVPGKKGEKKLDLRAFDADVITDLRELVVGQVVQCTGSIDNEALKNKAGNKVSVDGRDVWLAKHTIKTVKVEGASTKPNGAPPAKKYGGADDKGW